MLRVEHLTKRFAGVTAVDDVSFSVERGEIVGLLGPNGAGKTTTMRVLTCFFPASAGRVEIAGYDVFTESVEVRRRIGYMPENVPLYPEMRVDEYLRFRAKLKGVTGRNVGRRVNDVKDLCGLGDVGRRIIGQLSKGYRQRVGLAEALVHDPELLILDEPTIGLDPNQIRQVRTLIRELAQRHTILLSSHILPEVEMTCRRVLILNRGKIVASDTPERLHAVLQGASVIVAEIAGPQEDAASALRGMAGVREVRIESAGEGWTRFAVECEREKDLRGDVFRAVSAAGWVLRELRMEARSLEDVFVSLTRGEGGES